VAAVGDGVAVLNDTPFAPACAYKWEDGCQVCRPQGRSGVLVTITEHKYAPNLVQALFAARK
jgi:hypothetical protein